MLATLPLIVACCAIAALVAYQSRATAEREIQALENLLLEAKQEELRNYVTQARNSFSHIYGPAAPNDIEAQREVMQMLSAMIYGRDGFFFVYDYDGTNLVSPRQTELINRNWSDLTDSNGTPVIEQLVDTARQGAGWLSFLWNKPSTGQEAQMIAYVVGLQDWRWAVGTGIFIDDVVASVAQSRAQVEQRVQRTFVYIGVITLFALILVFASGLLLNIHERRLADVKLKELNQRVLDAQEDERGRVARELHDGISQILVGVRYKLETAKRHVLRMPASETPDPNVPLDSGIEGLSTAITEVRRISRDLRPGLLDDLGLGPALQALTDEFAQRTGIQTDFKTVVFRNLLNQDSKIALYRIGQEALTNIERHSGATQVSVSLRGHAKGATLRVTDNGCGLTHRNRKITPGIGLRNMQERVEQLDGHLRIRPLNDTKSDHQGLVIEATLPLKHLRKRDEVSN